MTKVINFLYTVFLAILFVILALLLFYFGQNIIAELTDTKPLIRFYTIISPSMEPNIKVYDIVVSTRVSNPANIQEGDVITFFADNLVSGEYSITHRVNKVIKKDGDYFFITKGDNNTDIDEGIRNFDDIEGKMLFKINGLGKLQSFLASLKGWIAVILIPAIVMIGFDIVKVVKIKKKEKQLNKEVKMKWKL